jgi:hypothetical protein
MDVDRRLLCGNRIIDLEPARVIRLLDLLQDQASCRSHDLLFKPAFGRTRVDDNDLRPMRLPKTLQHGTEYNIGGEVLALDIDQFLRPADRGEEKCLDLACFALVAVGRLRPGDADFNIREGRYEISDPEIATMVS